MYPPKFDGGQILLLNSDIRYLNLTYKMNGRLLKERMQMKSIKSEALAVMLGVSLSTVTNMRAGKDVEDITQRKVEEILDLPGGSLSGGFTDPEIQVSPQTPKGASG